MSHWEVLDCCRGCPIEGRRRSRPKRRASGRALRLKARAGIQNEGHAAAGRHNRTRVELGLYEEPHWVGSNCAVPRLKEQVNVLTVGVNGSRTWDGRGTRALKVMKGAWLPSSALSTFRCSLGGCAKLEWKPDIWPPPSLRRRARLFNAPMTGGERPTSRLQDVFPTNDWGYQLPIL